ncbi:MAG TPA: low-specificity L-threonine aldolase [Devosia sp.]|jgi:threonine aldolase
MSHCGRGDEFIAGQKAHLYVNEAGGAAVLGSIQPQPIAHQADGTMDLREIEAAIKPDDHHYARTTVIALENTFGGKVLPMDYMRAVAEIAQRHALGLHLDGARAFNACVALDTDIKSFTEAFDSVSICLSKGLGAPVGSVLIGRQDLIDKARRNRKMLGGGLRQSGILAAAGLYALDHNIGRLSDDHRRARRLAEGLTAFPELRVVMPDTNVVFVDVDEQLARRFADFLQARGVGVMGYGRQRWVTHLDVSDEDVEGALVEVAAFFQTKSCRL